MKQAIKIILSGIALALLSLALWESQHPINQRLRDWAYDSSYAFGRWAQEGLNDSPVIIAYLDSESYLSQGQDQNLPFSRALHARALDRLTQLGAKAVVYDIFFGGPHHAGAHEEDAAFAAAIQRNAHVVMGADLVRTFRAPAGAAQTRSLHLELPFEPFVQAAAKWGLVQLIIDPDFVVRHQFPGFLGNEQPSLTSATGELLGFEGAELSAARQVYYYGPPYEIPHISLASLLAENEVASDVIEGKVVFIGARPETPSFDERQDELRSPFGRWGSVNLFMPGVEVHATQLINLINQDGIRMLPAGIVPLIFLITSIGLAMAAHRCSIQAMFTLSAIAFFAASVLGIYLFHAQHVAVPWTHAVLLQIPLALSGNVIGRSARWYWQRLAFLRAQRIADAKITEQATLLNRAQDAIVVMTPAGERIYHNESARHLFNESARSTSDPARLDLWDSLPETQVDQARKQALETGRWEGEFKLEPEGLPLQKIESRWTLIRTTDNKVQSIMSISTDVTEKRQLEQQVLQSQRLDTIGSLAGGIAHDLNNALSPILMGVQLMRRQSQSEKAQRMLDVMEQSTQRGAGMVRQILAFTRGSGDDRQEVNLRTLTKDLEHLIKETFPKNIEVSSYIATDLWPLFANPTQIHQILLNLSVNARDAMPDGGHLTIAVDKHRQEGTENATLASRQPGQFILFMISDTGSGIPPELIKQVFDPFFSTKSAGKGTGLGLTTVRTIVEKHGGCIDISSEPNAGTTFEIYLPANPVEHPKDARIQQQSIPLGRGENILIADDEQGVREMLAATLEASGYQPILASNGVEAISALTKTPIDLIILDNDMPMMSGQQCLLELRKLRQDTPIILISGHAPEDHASKNRRESHSIILPKPFRIETLLQHADQLIRNKS